MADDAFPKCLGTNRDGSPCSAAPRADGFCMWHSPQLEDERAEWRKRGGENKANAVRARRSLAGDALTMAELHGLLSRSAIAVVAGTLDVGRANALANLARSIEAVARTAELEARIASYEQSTEAAS